MLRVAGFCAGNSPVIGESSQNMASNAETISIWWGHNIIVFICDFVGLHFSFTDYCNYQHINNIYHVMLVLFVIHRLLKLIPAWYQI